MKRADAWEERRLAVRRCGDWEGRPGRNFLEGVLRKLRVQAGEGGDVAPGDLWGLMGIMGQVLFWGHDFLDGLARCGCALGQLLVYCDRSWIGRLAVGDFESVIYSVATGK